MAREKARAATWFGTLGDRIVAAFEALEDAQTTGPFADHVPGRFETRKTTRRAPGGGDVGGGLMNMMRNGRIFEKAGVNVSTVHGQLGEGAQAAMAARRNIPGLAENPAFWASGISVVAHMQNPHIPAVHMNTRMFWTPGAWWFGGGADLNPCIEYAGDTAAFHKVLKDHCDPHGTNRYPRFRAWADAYFHIPHRGRTRGVGGIFYDDLNSGDWEADFVFTQDVGRAFLPAFLGIAKARRSTEWTAADRHTQLVHRGLYAEYNLLYDRGTRFGLETGHDPDAVLMSLPPLARWP